MKGISFNLFAVALFASAFIYVHASPQVGQPISQFGRAFRNVETVARQDLEVGAGATSDPGTDMEVPEETYEFDVQFCTNEVYEATPFTDPPPAIPKADIVECEGMTGDAANHGELADTCARTYCECVSNFWGFDPRQAADNQNPDPQMACLDSCEEAYYACDNTERGPYCWKKFFVHQMFDICCSYNDCLVDNETL